MDFFSISNLSFWLCVPSVLIGCWAISQKMKIDNWMGVVMLSLLIGTMIIDMIVIDYRFMGWIAPLPVVFASHYLNCMFFPCFYFYGSRKLNYEYNTWHFWMMVILAAAIILPNMSFVYDHMDMHHNTHFHNGLVVRCKHIAFILGPNIYQIPMELVIIVFQLILCCLGIRHAMHPSHGKAAALPARVYSIFKAWGIMFAMAVIIPFMPQFIISTPLGRWISFFALAAVSGTVFLFYGMGYDEDAELEIIRPSQEERDEGQPHEFESLAAAARQLFETEGFFFKQGLVIDEVVAQLGTNRTYFTRMMKAEFGVSFNEYVMLQRCQHARELLKETDLQLEEIAVRCGLGDTSSLNRIFKRYENDTPDHWRKIQRIEAFNQGNASTDNP